MIKLSSLQAIVRALDQHGIRFLIAGGVAVNGYGYLRVTKDLDIAIALDAPNFRAAIEALQPLGYAPKIPVSAEMIADPANRHRWKEEKGMLVFQLWADAHRETPIDVFTTLPFDFDEAYARSEEEFLEADFAMRLLPLDLLIAMNKPPRARATLMTSNICSRFKPSARRKRNGRSPHRLVPRHLGGITARATASLDGAPLPAKNASHGRIGRSLALLPPRKAAPWPALLRPPHRPTRPSFTPSKRPLKAIRWLPWSLFCIQL